MLLFYNVCFVLNWEIAAKTAARGKSFRAPAGNTGAVFDANYLKHLWQHNIISSVFKSVATVHNVHFVKYDVTVSFMAHVLDTVAYFVSHVLVVDTVTYFDIFR